MFQQVFLHIEVTEVIDGLEGIEDVMCASRSFFIFLTARICLVVVGP